MNSGRPEGLTDQAVDTGEDSGGGLDLATILHLVRFFFAAPRRHPFLGSLTAVFITSVAIAAAVLLPRTYSVDMRVVARRNPLLVQPGTPPGDLVAGAPDIVLKRDNLVAVVRDLDLVSRWDAGRSATLRFKDSVMRHLSGGSPPTAEQKARMLVAILEQHTFVSVDVSSSSMTLGVDWPNPKDAYDIVNALYGTFLDSRYDAEVSMYAEQLKVLDQKKEAAAGDVDSALAELTKLEQVRQKDLEAAADVPGSSIDGGAPVAPHASMSPAHPVARPGAAAANPDLDTAQTLAEVRTKIRNSEAEQTRRAAEADAQLADARAALGPLHPTLVALTRKAEAAREIPPDLVALRAQEKQLVQRLAEAATPAPSPAPPPAWTAPGGAAAPAPTLAPAVRMATDLHDILTNHEDAPTTLARATLASASQQYNTLLGRAQASKVELDVARSSFKEEYNVVRPTELPAKPRKPNVMLIVVGGIGAALFLFFAVPFARDLLGGVILEPWQIESRLKLPVLGELSSEGVGALDPRSDDGRNL
jgi:hypothetical protein